MTRYPPDTRVDVVIRDMEARITELERRLGLSSSDNCPHSHCVCRDPSGVHTHVVCAPNDLVARGRLGCRNVFCRRF